MHSAFPFDQCIHAAVFYSWPLAIFFCDTKRLDWPIQTSFWPHTHLSHKGKWSGNAEGERQSFFQQITQQSSMNLSDGSLHGFSSAAKSRGAPTRSIHSGFNRNSWQWPRPHLLSVLLLSIPWLKRASVWERTKLRPHRKPHNYKSQ